MTQSNNSQVGNLTIDGEIKVTGRIINTITNYVEAWSAEATYTKGDLVTWENNSYICIALTTSGSSPVNNPDWVGMLNVSSYNASFSNSFFSTLLGRTIPYVSTRSSKFETICIAPFPGLNNIGRPIHTMYATASAKKSDLRGEIQVIENGHVVIFTGSWLGGDSSNPNLVSANPTNQPSHNPANWNIQIRTLGNQSVYLHAVTIY